MIVTNWQSSMHECIVCIVHVLVDFLDVGFQRYLDVVFSIGFWDFNHLCAAKCQPKSMPLKLVIIFVDSLLCSRASSRVIHEAMIHFSRHVNIKMDKLWDPKVYPWLWEFMSLLLQNVHVDVWSCMEDVVLHKLLWHIFLENNICRLEIVVSLGHIEVQEFEQVISRNKSFLLKRNKSSLNTTNVFGCGEENILFVNDQPSSRVFKVVANKKNI